MNDGEHLGQREYLGNVDGIRGVRAGAGAGGALE
jgi:hypothetical protein